MAGYTPDTGYYHAMDRDYNPERLMPLREIGVSIMATKDAVQPLVAKIREGASKVEIGFMGRGKGSIFSGQITPESVDTEQREAIRLLAKVNKVDLSTHATVSTGGFAGWTNRGFDDSVRMANMQEVKRAIDFAADTAQGGAITLHADEFPRPLFDVDKRQDIEFLSHPHEKDEATFHIVDTMTGDVIQSVRKNVPVHIPEYEKDAQGNIVKDQFGNPVPKYDEKHKKFLVKEVNWQEIEKMAEKEGKSPELVYYEKQVESRKLQIEGERLRHLQHYEELRERRDRLKQALEFAEQLEELAGPDKERLKREIREQGLGDLVPERTELPSKIVKRNLDDTEYELTRMQQSALAQQEQLEDFNKMLSRLKPIKEFAVQKSADTIAQLGMYAFQVEQEKGLNKDKKRPLFIAPEGLFPESYGSHPQELKALIIESRKRMAQELREQKPGMTEREAEQAAADHIKATVDVGHMNTWRKYFQAKPGETIAETNARFNKWLLSEMEDLNKHKIVGHLHITDNFGYQDEHLTPGMGSAPIKEFVELMKKAGVTDMVVEPGAQDPAKQYEALYGGWKLFGHSIYGLAAPGKARIDWGDIEHTYFGQNAPPYFLFGEMALSEEYRGSPFWSGLGLE